MWLKRCTFGMMMGLAFAFCAKAQTATVATMAATPAAPSAEADRMRKQLADWANLARYRSEDEALPQPFSGERRVVFLGDSITDRWGRKVGAFFPGRPYINRGISSQTTPQMLIRFEQDVVHLHPAAVVILAGTNDIARNTGPSSPAMIEDNISSMVAIAKQNGIRVILASITPAAHYRWRPEVNGVADIQAVNQWLNNYCARNGLVYLDYYSAMSDESGAMKPGLSSDEVHPTEAGYKVMAPLAETAIAKALK